MFEGKAANVPTVNHVGGELCCGAVLLTEELL